MEQVLGPQAHHSEKPVLKNRQPKNIVNIEVAILRLER
ncbi:hypothetical protein T11_15888 [Trichinella zimbabwensis]|uniref:Uncharacterized protein n=1 Tax=Trichinella zimbabwensis TaxID=268475 RepID=A0A0V1FH14_9BILA|nr:hypothetical protein T11_15888 [Trichinella zimbabwensis]